ncbi:MULTISPECIES: hypothetical protein [Aphanothece]|uniref:hypothetical protein n=1 Tax=Aphanothece TaxID=1121 RepID=UPI003984EDA7
MSPAPAAMAAMAERLWESGGTVIADTALHTGRWRKVATLQATVFDAATVSAVFGLGGVSVAAGVEISGLFTAVKLTSGAVVAYL